MIDGHIGERAELYALGLLDDTERAAVDAHLTTCDACLRLVGEAEEAALALERTWQTVEPPAQLRNRIHFDRPGFGRAAWLAIAAAFVLGLLPSTALLLRGAAPPARNPATIAMIESHFNHAQFTGANAPPAKVIYARDRSWIYVIVVGTERYDVYAIERGTARFIGTTNANETTSEAFFERPGALDAVQLRAGASVIGEAKIR